MPLKFDDLHKAQKDALHEDFKTDGFEFKSKQKTNFKGAVATCTSTLFQTDSVRTSTKISWKMPTFFGLNGLSIDKLEMDAKGKMKLEATADKALHGVENFKLQAKSDLTDVNGVTLEATMTDLGMPGTQVKFETKPLNIANFDFNGEVTTVQGPATLGMKFNMASLRSFKPDVGFRVEQGTFVGSVLSQNMLSSFLVHGHFKVPCARVPTLVASYESGGKKDGEFHVGVDVVPVDGTRVRAKVHQGNWFSVVVKHQLAAGFHINVGAKIRSAADYSTGFGLHIE